MIASIRLTLLALVSVCGFASAAPLVFEGTDGPGKGKHIVFLAGDHEYRSEESLPAMARILAKHHGFKCTVLFDIDPATGEIVAGTPSNLPGLEALATADLAVVFLRFQALPAEQMKHLDDYLKRGGPVVGLRTATHAFSGTKEPYAKYNYNAKEPGYELGFGHQVLGQPVAVFRQFRGNRGIKLPLAEAIDVAQRRRHHQHRTGRGAEDFVGDAADQHARKPTATMGR